MFPHPESRRLPAQVPLTPLLQVRFAARNGALDDLGKADRQAIDGKLVSLNAMKSHPNSADRSAMEHDALCEYIEASRKPGQFIARSYGTHGE